MNDRDQTDYERDLEELGLEDEEPEDGREITEEYLRRHGAGWDRPGEGAE